MQWRLLHQLALQLRLRLRPRPRLRLRLRLHGTAGGLTGNDHTPRPRERAVSRCGEAALLWWWLLLRLLLRLLPRLDTTTCD